MDSHPQELPLPRAAGQIHGEKQIVQISGKAESEIRVFSYYLYKLQVYSSMTYQGGFDSDC